MNTNIEKSIFLLTQERINFDQMSTEFKKHVRIESLPNKLNVTFKLCNACLCQYYALTNDNEKEEFPSIILVT